MGGGRVMKTFTIKCVTLETVCEFNKLDSEPFPYKTNKIKNKKIFIFIKLITLFHNKRTVGGKGV